MRKIYWLGLMLLTHSAWANKQITCWISDFPTPGEGSDFYITYPQKGQTFYKLQLRTWDESTGDYVPFADFEGTGKLDKRMLDGKLTLFYQGTSDEAGSVNFVEPQDQEEDPSTVEVIGRVRELTLGTAPALKLQGCYLGNAIFGRRSAP